MQKLQKSKQKRKTSDKGFVKKCKKRVLHSKQARRDSFGEIDIFPIFAFFIFGKNCFLPIY